MKGLKDQGLKENRTLQNRVSRLFGLGRIGKEDHDYLREKLDEVEARIIAMSEQNPNKRGW